MDAGHMDWQGGEGKPGFRLSKALQTVFISMQKSLESQLGSRRLES